MAKRRPPTVHGLAIVDKPAGVTSHDVVNQLRKILGERRIGHAGTLDPDATGVLLVGVGYVTRLMQFLSGMDKTYTAEVVFGTETNTLDSAGVVTATHDMTGLTIDQVRDAATKLTGQILQVPPMVSALRVDGRRLHELAREGIVVERKARPVTVYTFDVQPTQDPLVVRIEVRCSSGTYVRTLAADLGTLLGGGAHLRNLRRTSIGDFLEQDAHAPEQVKLLEPITALRSMTKVIADEATATAIRNGRSLPAWPGSSPWAVVNEHGALLAVYEADGDVAKPSVVLAEAIA
jgi:tRNA pseudouridine55 synthase